MLNVPTAGACRRGPSTLVLGLALALGCGGGQSSKGDAVVTPGGDAGGNASDAAAGDDGPVEGGGGTGVSRTALLEAFGRCIQGAGRDFLGRAAELESATKALVASADAGTGDAARKAFTAAMDAWQMVEMMQVGPAAISTMPGGMDLRDHVYSWPLVNPCAVEAELVSRGFEAPTFPMALVNRRGLAALEYLLFTEGSESQCPQGAPAGWAALAPAEREARRRAYAAVAAADVHRRATALVDAWEAGKGGFAAVLASAGPGNKTFPTTQLALSAVSAALFYLDGETKDQKVGQPLGLFECLAPSCPESRFARRTKANVRANLVAFRRITEGCGAGFDGLGFDDLLEAVGAEAVAGALRQRGAAVLAALDAIEEPDLPEAAKADMASVRALHAAMKGLTDMLKMEFKTLLDLEIPKRFEGDND
jgi:predicted lipoprotein